MIPLHAQSSGVIHQRGYWGSDPDCRPGLIVQPALLVASTIGVRVTEVGHHFGSTACRIIPRQVAMALAIACARVGQMR